MAYCLQYPRENSITELPTTIQEVRIQVAAEFECSTIHKSLSNRLPSHPKIFSRSLRLCQKWAQVSRSFIHVSRTAFLPIDGAGDIEATANTHLQLAEVWNGQVSKGLPLGFPGMAKNWLHYPNGGPLEISLGNQLSAWIFLDPLNDPLPSKWSLYLVTPSTLEKLPSFYRELDPDLGFQSFFLQNALGLLVTLFRLACWLLKPQSWQLWTDCWMSYLGYSNQKWGKIWGDNNQIL